MKYLLSNRALLWTCEDLPISWLETLEQPTTWYENLRISQSCVRGMWITYVRWRNILDSSASLPVASLSELHDSRVLVVSSPQSKNIFVKDRRTIVKVLCVAILDKTRSYEGQKQIWIEVLKCLQKWKACWPVATKSIIRALGHCERLKFPTMATIQWNVFFFLISGGGKYKPSWFGGDKYKPNRFLSVGKYISEKEKIQAKV